MKKPAAEKKADSMTKFDGLHKGDSEKIFKIFQKSAKVTCSFSRKQLPETLTWVRR